MLVPFVAIHFFLLNCTYNTFIFIYQNINFALFHCLLVWEQCTKKVKKVKRQRACRYTFDIYSDIFESQLVRENSFLKALFDGACV